MIEHLLGDKHCLSPSSTSSKQKREILSLVDFVFYLKEAIAKEKVLKGTSCGHEHEETKSITMEGGRMLEAKAFLRRYVCTDS